jgi:hypothetical protein
VPRTWSVSRTAATIQTVNNAGEFSWGTFLDVFFFFAKNIWSHCWNKTYSHTIYVRGGQFQTLETVPATSYTFLNCLRADYVGTKAGRTTAACQKREDCSASCITGHSTPALRRYIRVQNFVSTVHKGPYMCRPFTVALSGHVQGLAKHKREFS